MHLLPADRADHRVIDEERVCRAIAALGDPESIRTQTQHYSVLADPTRLTLLTCISAVGPISVSDLAAATGLHDATVSQALRFLRAAQIVSTQRDGRVIRYLLADHPVAALLARR
jgi:DNA-binding transcriptional ArsR family regulator